MSRYWSELVHKLTPYVPGEQPKIPGLIKLNTNENPCGPSPKVLDALKSVATDTLRLYPDPNADSLKEALAGYYNVRTEQVFVGNGSDEVLAHTFHALLKHKQPVLFPDISYSFYPVYCRLYGINNETVALTDGLEINLDDYDRPNGGIIFPNPNAPTGRVLPLAAIGELLERNRDSVVVIDEAYIDFGGESAIALVDSYPNLLVIQTLSKSRALAGLRVGYAIGHPALVEALERMKNSFNSYPLNAFAIRGAVASLEDESYFRTSLETIIATRKALVNALTELGFEVLPSAANFVFARHPDRDAGELSARLRDDSILVRHFKQERIDQFLRISVGTADECAALCRSLETILG